MAVFNKSEILVLLKAIDHFEGSSVSTMTEDQHCRHIEDKLESLFKNQSEEISEIEILKKKLELESSKVRKAYECLDSSNLEDVPYNVACALGYN